MTESASFPALGSTAVVMTSGGAGLEPAVAAVREVVQAIDLACSRFRDDSELTALNRARGQTTRVSPLLLDAVGAALRAAQLTDGAVDPALGEALTALGYDSDFDLGLDGRGAERPAGAVGSPRRRAALSLAAVAGWRTISVDRRARTVGFADGVSLDLGATAKALAADRAAEAAVAVVQGCAVRAGVLVSLGGDIATAGESPAEGWLVRVTDDHRAGAHAPGQWITIRGGGLATSSTVARRWRTAHGETVHHLLDPQDGRPTRTGWRTASVAAAGCLDANIASTAAIVRGQPALAWLAEQGLPARLVTDAGTVVHVAGWPAHGDDLPTEDASAIPVSA